MQITLNGHNKTVQDQAGRKCISRKKGACPLERNCLSKEIIYQAKVTPDSKAETYVGLAATGFKGRFSFYLKKQTNKQTIKASIHAYFLPFLGLTNFKIIHNIRNFRICTH